MNNLHQRNKKQKVNIKKILIIYLVALTVIAIVIGVLIIFFSQNAQSPNAPTHDQSSAVIEKREDTISIPGYEGLTLKADTLQQTVSLNNPEQNACLFIIGLYLEDGTMLWQSDYIEPGSVSSPIVLIEALQKGTYHAVLRYSCFKMDGEKTPLNGAETKLTLRVK